MPFLAGRGQINIGRGFFAAGKKPDAPTFPSGANNNAVSDKQLTIVFDAGFSGRTGNN